MELANRFELFFKNYDKEISISDLIKKFKLNKQETELVKDVLYQLELSGKIIGYDNGVYKHKPDDFYLLQGIIRKSNKNKYYIVYDSGIVNITYNNLMGATEGDTVYVQVKKGKKHIKQVDGKVVRIVKKCDVVNIKTFYKAVLKRNNIKNYYYVTVDGNDIYIDVDDVKDAYVGDMVSVYVINNKYGRVVDVITRVDHQEILKYRKNGEKYSWSLLNDNKRIVKVKFDSTYEFDENDQILAKYEDGCFRFVKKIESDNSLKSKIDMMFYNIDMPIEFTKEELYEADEISKIDIDQEINKRVDLRDLITFTIDGEHAKDLDDAISLEIQNDEYILYVHIADVSFFVRPNCKLFNAAYLRGTSVYPADYVYPMLPKAISNGICSLNPNEDKLAKTIKMKFDKDGNLIDYKIFNSVINSNYRMNYNDVNKILKNEVVVDKNYYNYVDILREMNKLSSLFDKKKNSRGAISFNTMELEFIFGDNDKIKEITDRDREQAEKLIENFMLVANQIVSSFAYYLQTSYIYRNHDVPTIEQLTKLKYSLIKYRKYFRSYKNFDNPAILQKILYSIQKETNDIESLYYSSKILSCMNRAYYSENNNGHYALALPEYGTFTSPIRRFPDLFNHYIIGEIINGNIDKLDNIFNLSEMCKHATLRQLQAEEIERQTNNLLLSDFISNYKDSEIVGEIIFINKDFVCIKTKELFYGNIPMNKRERMLILDGGYKSGDKIVVKIDSIDEYSNQINFTIVDKINKKKLKKEGIR